MRQTLIALLTLTGLLSLTVLTDACAATEAEVREAARLLAVLLDAGRVVLAKNQGLINDPAKRDKGFTAESFEREIIEEYKQRTGVDLARLESAKIPDLSKSLLPALLQAGKDVIQERQSIINEKFLGYKNVIPATWGTWTSEKFSRVNGIILKQTALD